MALMGSKQMASKQIEHKAGNLQSETPEPVLPVRKRLSRAFGTLTAAELARKARKSGKRKTKKAHLMRGWVRESFKLTDADVALFVRLKNRFFAMDMGVKRSDILCFALQRLSATDDRELLAIMSTVAPVPEVAG